MGYRRIILGLAARPRVVRLLTRHGLSLGARRFVAGESLEEGIRAAQALGSQGLRVTLDYLGEKVTDLAMAAEAAHMYGRMLSALAQARLAPNVSLKLSQFGLTLDAARCLELAREVVARARELGGFVRLDMEESFLVDPALEVFRALVREFPGHVGPVLQAYLYRSEADLRSLLPLGLNVRLCKGAYSEPPSVAFAKKRDVDRNFRHLIRIALEGGAFVAVATHDEAIIDYAIQAATRLGAGDRWELQMLYGVKPRLQKRLAERGLPVRIYVPFGTHWYPYLIRRLAERPANVAFVLRGLWG